MTMNATIPIRDGAMAGHIRANELQTMQRGFKLHGGLATGDEVAGMLRARNEQPISMLARWIVGRSVVSFSWHSRIMLPLFQFHRESMCPCAGTSAVIAELVDSFDDWDLSSWFASPNAWIGGAAPAALVQSHPQCVLEAARLDIRAQDKDRLRQRIQFERVIELQPHRLV